MNEQKLKKQNKKLYNEKTYQLYVEFANELSKYRRVVRNIENKKNIIEKNRYFIIKKIKNLKTTHDILLRKLRKRLKINNIEIFIKKDDKK